MEFRASLDQLEHAARVLMASPSEVTKDDRNSAENIFITFRETRNAFSLCKFIFENSSTEVVLFEASDVLKNNLIQEWNKIPPDEIQLVNNHILQILLDERRKLSYSVLRRLSTVVAVIVKHQSLINNGQQRKELITHLESFMATSGHRLIVSCCLIDAILGEHLYVVHATDASLTYEMHFAAKKEFEDLDLLRIFQFCLRFLDNYSHTSSSSRDLDHVLKILENIFYWNFSKINLPKRVASVIEQEATPTFKPPLSWMDTVGDDGFIPIFFNLHMKIRKDENFIQRTLNLMIQLISMHGPLVQTKEMRLNFLSRILPSFTTLIEMDNKLPLEIFGLSDVVRKILLFHRSSTLSGLHPEVLQRFIKAVGDFSCSVIQLSIIEESKCSIDDRVFRDSLTRVLEAWMNVLTDPENVSKSIIQPIVTQIFNTYLQAHLSPPEGFRQSDNTNEDIEDEDEGDVNQFHDQLQAIGVIGRYILPHSVPILTSLLTFRCSAFQNAIQHVAGGNGNKESLVSLYEDLHWVILIAGHIFAFDGLGETNLIPPEIIEYSLATGGDPNASAIAAQNSLQMLPLPEGNSIDPMVRLVCCILSLSEMEHRVIESNLGHLLSPEVTANVDWFLQRWALSYFAINEEYYANISPCYLSSWGHTSQVALQTQSALFRRVRENLLKFNGELDVMSESINLLLALVDSVKKSETAINCPELGLLVQLTNQVGPGLYQMPNAMYRKFVRAVVSIGSFCEIEEKREQYWDQIFGQMVNRWNNCVRVNPAERHRDDVRHEISCVISGFIGTAMSLNSRTANSLYRKIATVVTQTGGVLEMYHNYIDVVELCLEFLTELARRSLSYLAIPESNNLYESAMSVVKSYAVHASGRRTSEKTDEEDTYNDLIILIDMLTCLLTKDFLDLSPDGGDGVRPLSACDVSLLGLGIVLPLLNSQMLKYPNLSSKYFRLIAFLSELHPDKIMLLPPDIIQTLFSQIQAGLQGTVSESFSSCCDFITSVGQYVAKHHQQESHPAQLCKPFLKTFLEMILSQKVSKDSMAQISAVLFACISAFSETFQELASQLIASRRDSESQEGMREAFTKLTENLNMVDGGDRVSRALFRDRLEIFIFYAKGCLN